MEIRFYETAESFRERVLPLLVKHEAENNLILGITTRLVGGQISGQSLMASVEDGGVVVAACVRTPLHSLVATSLPKEVVPALASGIRERVGKLSGVHAPSESAKDFVAAWGAEVRRQKHLRIYQLDRVIPPRPVPGGMDQAKLTDMDCVAQWAAAMVDECHMPMPNAGDEMRENVRRGETFIWRDGQPVCMAVSRQGTPNGCRIGMVYTPPGFRRKGYATALVAALSQHMLSHGCRLCFLYTDLDNPTSNHIYTEIGYRPVCDFEEHNFKV
jgi:predicted GNAT family acetyltransferase